MMFSSQFLLFLVSYAEQVLSVLVLGHGLGCLAELVGSNPAAAQGNILQTGHLLSLAFLYHLYECGCLGQGVMSSGIQPGKSASQGLQTVISSSPRADGLTLAATSTTSLG